MQGWLVQKLAEGVPQEAGVAEVAGEGAVAQGSGAARGTVCHSALGTVWQISRAV